jgi:Family of unknown function (DUF6152)
MTRNIRACVTATIAAAALVLTSLPLAAHHGTNISYDRTKQFTKQATVVRFEYKNPHPELWVDFKDDSGQVQSWALELLPNPAQLIHNGWSRQRSVDVMKAGTPVMVTVAPSKAGGVVGLLLRVTDMQGQELVTGGGAGGGRQGDPDAGRQGGGGRGN